MATDFWKDNPLGTRSIFYPDYGKSQDEKLLQIKHIVTAADETNYILQFEISTKGLKNLKATIFVAEVEVVLDEIAVPPTIIQLVSTGTQRLTMRFRKNKQFSKTILEGELEFKATVICDGLSAETEEFRLKVAKIKENKGVININDPNERKNISELKPSLNLYAFIKELEVLHKIIYDDNNKIKKVIPYPSPEGGNKTIGWGHKIKLGENFDSGISLEQAEKLLVNDVQTEGVKKLLNFSGALKITVPLNQNEYDAVISAIFGNGYGETLASAINKGADYYTSKPETIYKAFLLRRNAGSTFEDGLIKRRAREADIFIKNQWHSYGQSDIKFKTENEYINAFKNFLKTGLLPLLLCMIFISCQNSTQKKSDISSTTATISHVSYSMDKISDSIDNLIKNNIGYEGVTGSNFDWYVTTQKEYKLWYNELNNNYQRLYNSLDYNGKNILMRNQNIWEAYLFSGDSLYNHINSNNYGSATLSNVFFLGNKIEQLRKRTEYLIRYRDYKEKNNL